MKQIIFTFLLCNSFLFSAVLPSSNAQLAVSLVGQWQAKEGPLTVLLILNRDGTGKLDDADIRYTIQNTRLSVDEGGTINTYNFQLNGNRLTLSGGDLEKPMVFERPAGSTPSGLGGRRERQESTESKSSRFVGVWETQGPKGDLRLELHPDGTGVFGGGSVRWKFERESLSLTGPNGKTIDYKAALEADSLALSGDTLAEPVVFRRVPKETGSASAVQAGPARGENGLVGRWQGPEGTVEINSDGSLRINNVPYRYTLQENLLTLIGNDGSAPLPFRLSGNNLTVSLGGQTVTLRRISSQAVPDQPAGSGGSAAELAGKWCYFSSFSAVSGGGSMTDECFTIHPDGSYTYHREASMSAYAPGMYGGTASQTDDSGTFSISGTRLTVQSRSQGTSAYQLVKRNHPKTGDPMLCLDDRCYVTAYQRPPW